MKPQPVEEAFQLEGPEREEEAFQLEGPEPERKEEAFLPEEQEQQLAEVEAFHSAEEAFQQVAEEASFHQEVEVEAWLLAATVDSLHPMSSRPLCIGFSTITVLTFPDGAYSIHGTLERLTPPFEPKKNAHSF